MIQRIYRGRDEGGLTLIELLVVIVIIGILAGVVVFAVRGSGDKGKTEAKAIDARIIRTAQEAYCAAAGHYGREEQLLGQAPARNGQTYKFLSEKPKYNTITTGDTGEGNCNGTRYTIGFGPIPPTPPGATIAAGGAGGAHSLALDNEGKVWAWGNGEWGQLGNGTFGVSPVPGQVSWPTDVTPTITTIATGYEHSLALDNEGKVWAWGYNFHGQLGYTTTSCDDTPSCFSPVPGQVSWPTDVTPPTITTIAAGYDHSLALDNEGKVWAWGSNHGDTPVQVKNLPRITTIASGSNHSLALDHEGKVWAWGKNNVGQLGDGTFTDTAVPKQVCRPAPPAPLCSLPAAALSGITAIASGAEHSLARASDGKVWAWGRNNVGQLGDGTIINRPFAGQVSGLDGITITTITAGSYFALALDNDGMWAWGDNYSGQLGNGTFGLGNLSPNPVRSAAALPSITTMDAGYAHSLVILDDGTMWAWGYNYKGQLGNGGFGGSDCSCEPTPTRVGPWDEEGG